MANQEHVDILKQGVDVWNKWRENNPTTIPDLREADLERDILSGANLSEASLSEADLSGTNLSRANLSEADLCEVNLSGANLSEADLSGVTLKYAMLDEADLEEANLENANLYNVNLSHAILINANLQSANLHFANCTRADLSAANLRNSRLGATHFYQTTLDKTNFNEAELGNTLFSDLDLSTAKNLEAVKFDRRSTIGIDTITLSKGKIPESFLRGCGVPDEIITSFRDYFTNPIEFYSCFISYSHADKAFARQLHDFLQGRGIRCWLDEHQINIGDDIFEEVDRGIKLWDKVLLCASKDSLSSWWVDNEINHAFKKEQTIMKSRGKKVLALIPLDLDGFIFSNWENGKAEQVKSRLAADFQGWQNDNDKLQQQFELVLKALRTDGGREAPPISRL